MEPNDGPGLAQLPSYVALNSLRDQGWTIDHRFVADSNLAVQALIGGDANFIIGTPPTLLSASEQDESVKSIVDWVRQGWTLVSAPHIGSVEQLEGGRLAVHDEVSFTNTAAQLILDEYGIAGDVEIVFIRGSEVRAQALANGEIDATMLDIGDVVALQEELGVEFNTLVSLGELYPTFPAAHYAVYDDWAAENHAAVVQFVKEHIKAVRWMYANPDAAVAEALEIFDDRNPSVVEETVRTYLERELYAVDGGLTEDIALDELKFYSDADQVGLTGTPENVARAYDLTYIDEALAQLEAER